jgi:DNA-binding transcriptional regulator PaaX
MKKYLSTYPLATNELIHYPLMYPDTLKKYRIKNISYATLDFLYDYAHACGISKGALRTTLSRMKRDESIMPVTSDKRARYRVAPLQLEVMTNMQKKRKTKASGFTVADYSFEKSQEKQRSQTRALLQYCGFIRFAQNAYINVHGKDDELRKSLVDAGVGDNVFLFHIKKIDTNDLQRLLKCWQIPKRILFLKQFRKDTEMLIHGSDGSDADLFNRIGVSWVAYIIHVSATEPPLPSRLLPRDYPETDIYKLLLKASIKHGKKMINHWRDANRIEKPE